MKRKMGRLTVAAVAVMFLLGTANAATLLTDDFSYPDGPLVGNGGWVNHSGTADDLLVSSGAVNVQHGDPSEDAHVQFASQDSGVLTATFDIVVSDDVAPIGGGDYEYFAHFMLDGTFEFSSRLDVVPPNDALSGDYTLGIATNSSTAEDTLGVDFAYGSTVPVSLVYDWSTGLASVTAGGDTATSTTVDLTQVLDSFALRQSDSSNNELVVVDNLVVSHVPEPSLLVLLGSLVLLPGLMRRK